MSFPAYSSYQESGMRWLGKLPDSWRVVPFWTLFRRVKRTGFPEYELLSVYRDYGVIRKRDRNDNFNKPSEDLSAYQLVEAGDLAINKMKAWQGSLGVSPHTGIVSPAYFVYRARHEQVPAYLHYLLRSDSYAVGLMTISKGIRINQWDVDPDHLAQLPVPLPSIAEQTAIAAFLDRETAKIDALVEEQRRLIELLKEKRQAVISHAVTKGLDPTVPMKDSGVEWLGKVPAHWEVSKIKHYARQISKGTTPTTIGENFTSTGVRFLKAESIFEGQVQLEPEFFISEDAHHKLSRSALFPYDVLVVIAGATTGKSAVVPSDFEDANTNQAVAFVRPGDVELGPWLSRWIGTDCIQTAIRLSSVQSAQPNLSLEELGNLPVLLPPDDERHILDAVLSAEEKGFEALTQHALSSVDLLQERRAALISAAVTGKIDVRDAVQRAVAA